LAASGNFFICPADLAQNDFLALALVGDDLAALAETGALSVPPVCAL